MQHIIINWDSTTNKLIVDPQKANIWRDDQSVMWSFGPQSDGMSWMTANAVFFPTPAPQTPWGGSAPAPIGSVGSNEPDRRPYVATGGGPNSGATAVTFVYDMLLNLPTGQSVSLREHLRAAGGEDVALFDPEIVNQPQP